VVDILRHGFFSICALVGFPFFISNFLKNPGEYLSRFGVDPEIIDRWPTSRATPEQKCTCVICIELVEDGDEVLLLNCPGNHVFHSQCIKTWLKKKIVCPLCKCKNVL
jgi:hypothetical protein